MRLRTLSAFALVLASGACAHLFNPPLVPTPVHGRLTESSAVPRGPNAVPNDSATVVQQSEAMKAPGPNASFGTSASGAVGDDGATDPGLSDAPASWDIDVRSYESMDRVERYVAMFTGAAKSTIEQRLGRGTRYEAMIRGKLRDDGLPEDLYYLALIESGFDPNASSSAAAVGMWQFMAQTARDEGLRIDRWIDERRDPVKSTDAAVRFIKELDQQFGSVYLAAAAYNGGPTRISRGLTRYADDFDGTTGDDLFFALADKGYLRNETREYVPQLIAAALIAKDPDRYDITIPQEPPFVYDSVRIGPATPLAAVARAAHVDVNTLRYLNPQILLGMAPPTDSLTVRVPVGSADGFATRYAALPESERTAYATVRSKKGQSVASIARHAGISSRQLTRYNSKLRRLKSGNLAAGQLVLVPAKAVIAAAPPSDY